MGLFLEKYLTPYSFHPIPEVVEQHKRITLSFFNLRQHMSSDFAEVFQELSFNSE